MNTKNLFLFLLLMSFVAQLALADSLRPGIYVEPALTFERGTATVDFSSPLSTSSGSADGFGLSGKFGYQITEIFFIALDGRYSMVRYHDSSANYDARSISTNWGPMGGVQLPRIGLRAWTTLVIGGGLDPEKSGSVDVAFRKANGYRLGTGLHIYDLSLNIEYQQLKYGETALEQVGPSNSGAEFDNANLDNRSWVASISFPIGF